jgi:hypothetical protein
MSIRPLDSTLAERLLELRGWTPEAIERLGLGFDGRRVVFSVRDGVGELVGYTHLPAERRTAGRRRVQDVG